MQFMVTFLVKKEVKLSKTMCRGMSCVTIYLFCFAPSIANPEHFNLESIELNVLWSDRTEAFPSEI